MAEIMTPEEQLAVIALLQRMRARGLTGDLWAVETQNAESAPSQPEGLPVTESERCDHPGVWVRGDHSTCLTCGADVGAVPLPEHFGRFLA